MYSQDPFKAFFDVFYATYIQYLKPICCKKQQKKVPDQLLVCGIGDLWRYKIDPGWSRESRGLIYNQFGIIQLLQSSPIPQTSNWFLQQTGSRSTFDLETALEY